MKERLKIEKRKKVSIQPQGGLLKMVGWCFSLASIIKLCSANSINRTEACEFLNETYCLLKPRLDDLYPSLNLGGTQKPNQTFTIYGEDCFIKTSEKIFISQQTGNIKIILSNCTLYSTQISLDLIRPGAMIGGSQNTSILLANGSMISSTNTSSYYGGRVPGSMYCYSGCSNPGYVYGDPILPVQSVTNGDNQNSRISSSHTLGSGAPNSEQYYSRGGGRIYLRANSITIDTTSAISANGFQGNSANFVQDQTNYGGTGGTIFITAITLKINLNSATAYQQNKFLIQAEGSNFSGLKDDYVLGGGGRIYLYIFNLKNSSDRLDIQESISASGYGGMTTFDYNMANSGTIYINYVLNQTDYLIVKNSHPFNTTMKNRKGVVPTYFHQSSPIASQNLTIQLNNSNYVQYLNEGETLVEVALIKTTNSIFSWNTNNGANSLQINLKSLSVNDNSIIMVNSTGSNVFTVDGDAMISQNSTILLQQNMVFTFISQVFSLTENSTFQQDLAIYQAKSQLLSSLTVELVSQQIIISESTISVQKLNLSPQTSLSITSSIISNNGFYSCPDQTLVSKEMDQFLQDCRLAMVNLTCYQNYRNNFIGVTKQDPNSGPSSPSSQISFVMINSTNKLLNIANTKFNNVGYFLAYADTFTLDADSVISTSQTGCPTTNPTVKSDFPKFLKVCKVEGGSNIGRGSFGKDINVELCKYLMPMPQSTDLDLIPISGLGGKKSHSIKDSVGSGFGGGIVNIRSGHIEILGQVNANGGNSYQSDYSQIAGGSGGSIKLTANKIILHLLDSENFQISAKGGKPDAYLGGGGGGKLILNCLLWNIDQDCIEIGSIDTVNETKLMENKILLNGGAFGEMQNTQRYFLTMHMLYIERSFIFDGGVINQNPCWRGRGGPFCLQCPMTTYKSDVSTHECLQCPCDEPKNTNLGKTNVAACDCPGPAHRPISIFHICLVFAGFGAIMKIFIYIVGEKKKFDDKTYQSHFRYRVKDIRNSVGRIFVLGSNTPPEPWKIEKVNPKYAKYFNTTNLDRFRKHFHEIASWPSKRSYFLSVLRVLSYSPGYLSILRILMTKKKNSVIELIEKQEEYQLFRSSKNKRDKSKDKQAKEKYVLKWTSTSDMSTLFLDIVRVSSEEDNNLLMNWKLNFPQSFVIFGNGTYNRPFKLEIRDPRLIKMIDHLKAIVADSKKYLQIFQIPIYIVNSMKIINQKGHFMEYYFCVLNAHLKSLSMRDPRKNFCTKFGEICDYLEKGNRSFLQVNRYSFQLELILDKLTNRRRQRYRIKVPLKKNELRSNLSEFFYKILNQPSEGTSFTLRLKINELKNLQKNQYANAMALKSRDFLRDSTGFSKTTKNIIDLKNDFKKMIITERQENEEDTTDFEYLESVYLSNRKISFYSSNIFTRYVYKLIYKHHFIKKSMGYVPGLIFVCLILEMTVHLFSIYNAFLEEKATEKFYMYEIMFEWFAPFPFSQLSSLVMGVLCFVTSWRVKVGKMFVSSNLICVANLIMWFCILILVNIMRQEEEFGFILLYFLPSLAIRFTLSYFASLHVARIQTSKTMHKILDARNTKDT